MTLDRGDATSQPGEPTGTGAPAPPAAASPVAGGPQRGPEGIDTGFVGLLAFLGTVSMLFLGFTSALLLRRASFDWQPLAAPSLLWLSTALLLLSSVALAVARARERRGLARGALAAAAVSGALAIGFVGAQLGAWRQLARAGVFLASNPSSSFFFVLTGAHALHVLGAIGWFPRAFSRLRAGRPDALRLYGIYWHYLGGLWLYLVVLMFGL